MIDNKLQYKRTFIPEQVVIEASGTSSTQLDCGGVQVMGLIIPSAWTTGDISFTIQDAKGSSTNYTLSPFDGTELNNLVIPAVTSGKWIPLVPYWFAAVPFLKINCSVAQAEQRTITVALQPLFQGIHG